MYKNQLQELAQRSCFNLPSYSCVREGPDHDPRFKATVNFNGEVFESPGYHTTIRQAEHSAAEVALNTLSNRGPSHSLASRILDDTGVSKNLLQETAQRAGSSLPVYTTVRSGPKHQPLFKCIVEIGGKSFEGEPAKTKKQAEKNAAMAAWSSLKNLPPSKSDTLTELSKFDNHRDNRSYENRNRNDKSGISSDRQLCRRSNIRSFNARDKSYTFRDGNSGNRQTLSTVHPNVSHLSQNKSHGPYWMNNGACSGKDNKYVYDQQFTPVSRQLPVDTFPEAGRGPSSSVRSSQRESRQNWRRHSMSGIEIPDVPCSGGAFVNQVAETGSVLGNVPMQSQESRARGLPYQSLSERFDLNRQLLLDELQQREEEGEWFHGDFVNRSAVGGNVHHNLNIHQQEARRRTLAYQSLSERFDPSRMLLLEELQQRDDGDECLYGDVVPAYGVQNHGRHMPLHSLSERFEVKYHLPLLEEVPDRDEWDWLPSDDTLNVINQTQNLSTLDNNQSLVNSNNGFKEGWLRGEKLVQLLEDQKKNGFKKGWLQGEIIKHNTDKKETCTDEWLGKSQAENSLISDKVHTANDSCDEWEPISKSIEQELSKGHGFTEQKNEKKHVYHTSSTNSKSLSSLWSKSAHWWGSHIPTKTSSAAVAFASTLGLRPTRSATPVANMSCQIVSMSLGTHHETNASNTGSSFQNMHPTVADEGSTLKLLNKLRL